MGRKFEDLTGKKFSRLTVIKQVPDKRPITWECLCNCGKTTYVTSFNLKSRTKSCGCLRRENVAKHSSDRYKLYLAQRTD